MAPPDLSRDQVLGYEVRYERERDGTVVATVPSLDGISTFGASREEAARMARDMIALVLLDLEQDGITPPTPDGGTDTVHEGGHANRT